MIAGWYCGGGWGAKFLSASKSAAEAFVASIAAAIVAMIASVRNDFMGPRRCGKLEHISGKVIRWACLSCNTTDLCGRPSLATWIG